MMIYYIVGAAAALVPLLYALFNYRRKRRLLAYFAGDFYKPATEDEAADFDRLPGIRRYWDKKVMSENIPYFIDDVTWDDLDMDHVFVRMNACQSSTGEECLYARLRTVCLDEAAIKRFAAAVDFLDTHRPIRAKLLYALHELGKDPYNNVSSYIYGIDGQPIDFIRWFYVLAALPVAFGLACFFTPVAYALTALAAVINILLYYHQKFRLDMNLNAMAYITGLVRCAGIVELAFSKPGHDAADYRHELARCLRPLRKLSRLSGRLSRGTRNDIEVWLEYVKMIFLWDFIQYDRLIRLLKKHSDDFRRLHVLLGELDCAAAISAYRRTLPFYAEPVFVKSELDVTVSAQATKKTEGLVLTDVYHPLINHPVCNSLDWRKNALITGSNASGKSTLIKALALSAICAQALGLCFARSYRGGLCRVVTSMAVRDRIYRGESYFIAEINSLKRIMDSQNDGVRTLCFIDEILRGTNTVERIAASASILHALGRGNGLIMAATHDIELTELLAAEYDNYHFEEQVTETDIVFDYRLKPGRAQSRNAIRLLRLMGFGESITAAAEQMADCFTQNRRWDFIKPDWRQSNAVRGEN